MWHRASAILLTLLVLLIVACSREQVDDPELVELAKLLDNTFKMSDPGPAMQGDRIWQDSSDAVWLVFRQGPGGGINSPRVVRLARLDQDRLNADMFRIQNTGVAGPGALFGGYNADSLTVDDLEPELTATVWYDRLAKREYKGEIYDVTRIGGDRLGRGWATMYEWYLTPDTLVITERWGQYSDLDHLRESLSQAVMKSDR